MFWKEPYISSLSTIFVLPVKFICIYCSKILDINNFQDFINDSENKDAELHGWKLMPELEEEAVIS